MIPIQQAEPGSPTAWRRTFDALADVVVVLDWTESDSTFIETRKPRCS